jgi:hypothetical protein
MSALSPFYPQLRTLVGAAGTAAQCHKQTSARCRSGGDAPARPAGAATPAKPLDGNLLFRRCGGGGGGISNSSALPAMSPRIYWRWLGCSAGHRFCLMRRQLQVIGTRRLASAGPRLARKPSGKRRSIPTQIVLREASGCPKQRRQDRKAAAIEFRVHKCSLLGASCI